MCFSCLWCISHIFTLHSWFVSLLSSVLLALLRDGIILILCSHTQIFEIVNLANELLPPLPQGTISLPISTNFVKGPVVKKSPAGTSAQQEDTNGNPPEISAREKLLNEQPELLKQFGMDLLPVLIQVDIYCIDYMH